MGSNDVVIQLASFNSSNRVDNAEWSNHTKEGISINQGDTVVVSKAYLDTRLSNTGDIIIAEDLEVSLELYFYWINDGNNGDYDLQTNEPYPQPNYSLATPAPQANYCVMSSPFGHPLLKYNDGIGSQDPASQWTRQDKLYADGRPYLVVYTDNNGNETPYTQWWKYTIKAGSYTPDGLASILTTAMANVRKDDIRTLQQGKPSQWLQEDTTDQIWDEPFILNTTQWVNCEEKVENRQSGSGYLEIGYIVNNYIPIIPNDGRAQPPITPYRATDPNKQIWVPPQSLACKYIISDYPIQNPSVNLPTNITDPQNFYLFPLKKLYAGSYDLNGGYTSQDGETHWVAKYNFPILGATEISIVYNDTSSVFEWQYLHTPILQSTATSSSGDYQEVVGLVKTDSLNVSNDSGEDILNGNITMCKLDRKSGVMFRTMNPPRFWFDLLGFAPSIVVKDSEVIGQITTTTKFPYKRFLDITTGGFLGIADNFDQSVLPIKEAFNPIIVNPPNLLLFSPITDLWDLIEDFFGLDPAAAEGMVNILGNALYDGKTNLHYDSSWFQSITTVPLQAVRAPLNQGGDNSGHQLVEITGYQSNFLNETDRYQIKAIVSSYYVSPNSFTTSPFQDTYIYTHIGAPININTYTVRILDPLTMQKVKTLGTNSTVYLQITKTYSEDEQRQVEV